MMRRISLLFLIAATALMTGCASAPYMPLSDETYKLDTSKPLYLMSVSIKNTYKERYQPQILNVVLDKNDGVNKPETIIFRMDSTGTIYSEDSDTAKYLVRFPADTVPHIVRGLNARASAFPFHGFYFLPLLADLRPSENGIYYLGSVEAVIRERKEGEFRAGHVIPLVDQAVAGASTGTFDVEIKDAYEEDIDMFRATFPALTNVEIKRTVLPKWSRDKARLLWETK